MIAVDPLTRGGKSRHKNRAFKKIEDLFERARSSRYNTSGEV